MKTTRIASAARTKRQADTRTRILAEAMRLFAENGYAATSIKNISDAAGANIAAVNYHFGTKANLLRSILDRFAGQGMQPLAQVLQPPAGRDEFRLRLELFLDMATANIAREPEIPRIILRETDMIPDICGSTVDDAFTELYDALIRFFSAARRAGIVRSTIEPARMAFFLDNQVMALIHRTIVLGKRRGGDVSDQAFRKKWVGDTLDLFLGGVLTTEGIPPDTAEERG